MRNVKLAFRMLLKSPFVTAVAVLSLALGIGANAAIYSLFDQILLRPLPVTEPQQLVNIGNPGPKPGSTSCSQAGPCDVVFSYPMFKDLEEKQTSFSGIAAHRNFGVSVSIKNEPSTGAGLYVSGSYFPVLGLRPAAGRLLTQDDDKPVGANFNAVISYPFWQDHFAGSASAVGQTMLVNGKSFTIVGVAPDGFDGTVMGNKPIVYAPLSVRGAVGGDTSMYRNRRSYSLYVFGRLKPGVTIDAAKRSINAIYSPIINDVEAPLQQGMSDTRMKEFRAKLLTLDPGARGQSSLHTEAKTPIYLLFAITGVVLLIACANIANLLLARGATRVTEMGVRLALGAGRRQLLAQLITESVLLAVVGGIVSLAVAKLTLTSIASMMPPDAASTLRFELEPSAIVFAGVVAVVTGLVFGLFPALHSTRDDLISVIRSGAGQLTGGRSAARFRSSMVTVQIALSMSLLPLAMIFVASLGNLTRLDMGLKVDNVATFSIVPARMGYDSTRSAVLFDRVQQELSALPGVTGVTSSLVPLLAGDNWGTGVRVQGFQCLPDTDCGARYNEVGEKYMSTLGMQLVDGREFTDADRKGATKVAIVNEEFARKFNLGRTAVGKFMAIDVDSDSAKLDVQIIGLLRNAKYSSVRDSVPAVFYSPWRQDGNVGSLYFYVRSSLPPAQILQQIPALMKRLDPTLPVEDLKTMPQQVRESIFLDRMISILSSAFAVLATLLAAIGLYGVLAYTVAQRTREIGVRMALGADRTRVQMLVLRQMSVMLVVGAVVGIGGAIAMGRGAEALLFGVKAFEPLVFALAIVLMVVIALAAGWVPARRAASVDPMRALRYD